MSRRLAVLFVLVLGIAACAGAPRVAHVVLQSDFGRADHAVAAMHGVAHEYGHALVVSDSTHEIPPFDVWQAAYRLNAVLPSWPAGTVFVSVVDPGVGTDRRAVVARTKSGHRIVTPDNGTLTLVADQIGFEEVRVIDADRHLRPGATASHTFHGRDLFAVVAAKLASGSLRMDQIGASLADEVVRLPYPKPGFEGGALIGFVPVLDVQFGNVWTNLETAMLSHLELPSHPEPSLVVTIRGPQGPGFAGRMPFVRTFGDVPLGQPLAYVNSLGNLAFALNSADFAKKYGIGTGPNWRVEVRRG